MPRPELRAASIPVAHAPPGGWQGGLPAPVLAGCTEPLVWNDEWQAKAQVTINDHGKHRTVEEMVAQRIGDVDGFQAYQRTVLDATECWLYWHGLRDMGEIEVARGLVGLGGMTS